MSSTLPLVLLDRRVPSVHRDRLEQLDQWDLRDHKGFIDHKGLRVLQGRKGRKDLQDRISSQSDCYVGMLRI